MMFVWVAPSDVLALVMTTLLSTAIISSSSLDDDDDDDSLRRLLALDEEELLAVIEIAGLARVAAGGRLLTGVFGGTLLTVVFVGTLLTVAFVGLLLTVAFVGWLPVGVGSFFCSGVGTDASLRGMLMPCIFLRTVGSTEGCDLATEGVGLVAGMVTTEAILAAGLATGPLVVGLGADGLLDFFAGLRGALLAAASGL